MKIFLLCEGDYEDWWILGAFTSKEKRDEYVQKNAMRTPVRKQLRSSYFFDEIEVEDLL